MIGLLGVDKGQWGGREAIQLPAEEVQLWITINSLGVIDGDVVVSSWLW